MAWQEGNRAGSGSCFGRQRKVRPLSTDTRQSKMVEIRPRRVIRIQHINPRERDPKFEKEIQMQLLYKSQGLQAGLVSAGPLSMPKNKQVRGAMTSKNEKPQTPLPNSVAESIAGDDPDGKMREISASGSKAHFTSPSNVHVALQNTAFTQSGAPVPSSMPETLNYKTEMETDSQVDESGNASVNARTSFPQNQESAQRGEKSSATSAFDVESSVIDKPSTSVQVPSKAASSRLDEQTPESTPQRSILQNPRKPSTVLFFIHGVGGSSDVWQAQIRHFAKDGYEIIAPDLIGHGMSGTPQNARAYHFREIAADMEEIFDKYCKKRNVLIGHSYGCSFAVLLARRRSRRVQKLVLINGGAPTPLAPQPGIFNLPTCMLQCFRPCLNCGFRKSAFHDSRRPVLDKKEAFSIPTYVLQHTMNGQDWSDGDEVYHQWLLCPTLLIYGEQDKLVSLKEEEHMEQTVFRSRLEIVPEASHMVMIEAPDEINRLLLSFMTEDSTLCTKSNSPQPPAQPPPSQPEGRSVSRMSARSTKSHRAMPTHLT